MARARDVDEERRSGGLVRVVDEDELDEEDVVDEEDDPTPRPKSRSTHGNGGNGIEGDDELRAEVAKLRGEVALLRVAAGLEGRREEVATVGDVLDANQAQAEALRVELAEAFRQNYDDLCDTIAERVEERLLDTVAPEDEDEEHGGAKSRTKPSGRRSAKRSGPRDVRELEGPYVDRKTDEMFYVDGDGNRYGTDGDPI
jgi:hypothetical protein